MIKGFVGLPGSGKTYYATKLALKAIKKGINVYSNYEIVGAWKYNTIVDILPIRRGMIIIDEINILCPSRYWAVLPPELLYFWGQSRKLGVDIVYTSQSFARVDTVIRELTNYVYKFARLPFHVHFFREYFPEDLESHSSKSPRFLTFGVFPIVKSVYSKFNTFEEIALSPDLLRMIRKKMGIYSTIHRESFRFVKELSSPSVDIGNEKPEIVSDSV